MSISLGLQSLYVTCLSSLQEKESWDMNTAEKIEAAGKKKEEGNALFKAGKYARASKRYEKVCSLKNSFWFNFTCWGPFMVAYLM